jgi:hypothetical protein
MHYTNLRTIIKVDGEMSLVMTVYNMKRSINILGVSDLISRLKTWKPDYERVALFYENRLIYLLNEHIFYEELRLAA